jgi:pimeloyl-ACP methyl ester carboxylesterase
LPTFQRGPASIHYEEEGRGFPLLALAPGGMRSTIEFWANAAVNPWSSFTDSFRVIVMDQRNAGASRGPLDSGDPWGMYAADQLALLDELGVGRFAALGCCIGGSFVLRLAREAPERLVAGVLEQPIGVHDANRHLFAALQSSWAEELAAQRRDLDRAAIDAFLARMWAGDFVVSVERDDVAACRTPLLVLPGIDDYHPTLTGREIAAMAQCAELLEPWKETPELVAESTERVREWLLAATSGEAQP